MSHTRTDKGDETVLEITGTLDTGTAPEVRHVVDAIVADRRKEVTVELAGLDHIDETGVEVIVSLYKRIKAEGGTVEVVGIRDQPKAKFRLLRLDKVFSL